MMQENITLNLENKPFFKRGESFRKPSVLERNAVKSRRLSKNERNQSFFEKGGQRFIDRRRPKPQKTLQERISIIIKSHPTEIPVGYSACGSEELEVRIAGHLSLIKKYLLMAIVKNRKITIVLGGSYGRGEGGVLKGRFSERPFNDYDFFVFVDETSLFGYRFLNSKLKRAKKLLSKELGIIVDFSPAYNVRMLPSVPPTLRWYDLKHGHRVLLGDSSIPKKLPKIQSKNIPIQEAIQLLLNRGVGLLQAKMLLERGEFNTLKTSMLIYKTFIAIGDAFLLAKGTYHHSAEIRLAIMEEYSKEIELAKRIYPFYIQAFRFKKSPEKKIEEERVKMIFSIAERIFKVIYLQLFSLYYDKPLRSYKGFPFIVKKIPVNDYRSGSLIKNLALNVSCFGLSCLRSQWSVNYPANRLYAALPYFLFNDVRQYYIRGEIEDILCVDFDEKHNIGFKKRYYFFLRIWSRFN